MLRFDANTYALAQDPPLAAEQPVLVLAVDGTHSAGKTTVISDDLADKELLSFDAIGDFGTKHEHTYPYVCIAEKIGELSIPVVVASESARWYDSFYPDKHALTDGYNRDSQASMTMRAFGSMQAGAAMSAAVARQLQPERAKTISAVLTDRGILSGFVYARLRLPDQDHMVTDLARISDLPAAPWRIDIGEQMYKFATAYDKVWLTDHTEVAFEDDSKRLVDEAFRDQIAAAVHDTYHLRLEEDKISTLRGTRVARKQQLETELRHLLHAQLTA